MKNQVPPNEERRASVSALTRATDIRHTQTAGPLRGPRQPEQLAHETVVQGTVGLRVMLASEI